MVDVEPNAEQVALFREGRGGEVPIVGHGEGCVGDGSDEWSPNVENLDALERVGRLPDLLAAQLMTPDLSF